MSNNIKKYAMLNFAWFVDIFKDEIKDPQQLCNANFIVDEDDYFQKYGIEINGKVLKFTLSDKE